MLRSGIRSEILDLPVPSRHGKERCLRNKKEIIPLELVQYHQYSKCISFARAGPVRNQTGRGAHPKLYPLHKKTNHRPYILIVKEVQRGA